MSDFTIKIEGLDVLERRLQALGRNGARRAFTKGLRQGANVIKDDAKRRVRVKSGKLKKSIKTKNQGLKNGNITFSVGSPSPLAHLIEYGHLLVKGGPLSGGGHVVGWVPAYPYLRPAIENNVTNVTTKIKDVTGAAIDFEVAKLK